MDNQTNNPQAAAPTSLQQTGGDSLQTTSNQTVPSINQLDSSGQAIPLSSINSSTSQPAPVPAKNHAAVYSVLGVLVLIVVIVFSYSLVRER